MIDKKLLNSIIFKWSDEKNNILKQERNVCFEDVLVNLNENSILDIVKNPSSNFDNQYCMVLKINNYIYLVPFVINKSENTIFLKTIYPSRKFTKLYLNN